MELLQDFSYIPFFILATVAVSCALSMITNPNLVRAGFTLIGCFCAISGIYFLLAANFVAVSQVLIYAVGIVLVIVFAVMLCSLKQDADKNELDRSTNNFSAAIICAALFAVMVVVIKSQDWWTIAHVSGAERYTEMIAEVSQQYTSQIGSLMLSNYVLPFELVSVLLLIVLVGVIILSKKDISDKVEEKK